MITLFSGIPGSGKTYLMMSQLDRVKDKYFVIHNIDGLKKDYLGQYGVDFVEYCENEKMEVINFLSKDFQIEFTAAVWEKYHRRCLVIVDEAHEWFHRNRITLVMWLSYHRHLNQTIWLVAHRSTNIPAIYRSYIELEYRAKSSSLLFLPMLFFYNRISSGVTAGYTFARKRKKIFDLYKSQNDGFVKEAPSLVVPVAIGACLLLALFFATMPSRLFSASKKEKTEIKADNKTEIKAENKANKNVENEEEEIELRFVGKVGNNVYFEDQRTKQILKIDDLPDLIVLKVLPNKVILFDTRQEKNMTISSRVQVMPKDKTIFSPEKMVLSDGMK